MPRARQGGPRAGQQGGQYPNRSDLRNPANDQASGQEYGERQRQQAAQNAVPITPPPGRVPVIGPTGGSISPIRPPGPGGGASPTPPPAAPTPGPGELTPLFAPTERPGEPVTTGIDIGPGAGSRAQLSTPIGMVANNMGNGDTAAALLTTLASRPDAGSTIQNLARVAVNGPIR